MLCGLVLFILAVVMEQVCLFFICFSFQYLQMCSLFAVSSHPESMEYVLALSKVTMVRAVLGGDNYHQDFVNGLDSDIRSLLLNLSDPNTNIDPANAISIAHSIPDAWNVCDGDSSLCFRDACVSCCF